MKKCPTCGRMYSDIVSVCPDCKTQLGSNTGSSSAGNSYQQPQQYVQQTQQTQQPYQQQSQSKPQPAPKKDSGSFLWGIPGFLVPIIGVILYFCWKKSRPNNASVALKGAAIGFIVNMVLQHIPI